MFLYQTPLQIYPAAVSQAPYSSALFILFLSCPCLVSVLSLFCPLPFTSPKTWSSTLKPWVLFFTKLKYSPVCSNKTRACLLCQSMCNIISQRNIIPSVLPSPPTYTGLIANWCKSNYFGCSFKLPCI